MLFTKTAIMLAALPFTMATTCTSSIATAWPANNDFSEFGFGGSGPYGGAQDVQGCANYCKQDQNCVTNCLALIMQGQCNAVGGSACDGLKKRATLDCTSSETCYQYTDGSLLCLNLKSGLYHDDVGGNGSIVDGTYTSPSGQVQTGTGTPEDTATSVATTSRRSGASSIASSEATTSAGNAGTGTSSTRPPGASIAATRTSSSAATGASASAATGTSSNAATGTSAAASTATSNAAEKLRAGAIVGALGLAVRLVL